jgi:uncharacterized membrane protein
MGSLSQAKTLGGIGAILTLLLLLPGVGFVLVIVGWILILLALKNVSEVVNDRSIFNNAMISAILAIVSFAVLGIFVVGAILGFIGLGSAGASAASSVFGLIAGLVAGLVVGWILLIVSAYFLWQAFKGVSAKTNVGLFGTAALIYFIGAILTVILVGFLLLFVAQILFVVAFFSLPDNPSQPQPMGPPPVPPATTPPS